MFLDDNKLSQQNFRGHTECLKEVAVLKLWHSSLATFTPILRLLRPYIHPSNQALSGEKNELMRLQRQYID